jgi:hypothetical protein
MRKILLPLLGLTIALGTVTTANAQVGAAVGFARMMARKKAENKAEKPESIGSYQGKEFPMLRTPADKLPKKGAEPIVELEAQLARCNSAMLASPTGVICTPEQRAAIQTAIVKLAEAKSSRNVPDYQQEASFYLAEDARRQQAAGSAAPTN